MKKFIYSFLFIGLLTVGVQGQSGLKLTDYYNNPIQYNPAYVGVTGGFFSKATYSTQWLGFDDSPTTQTLDLQRRFNNERYAAGISILNDDFGAVNNFNVEGNFALHLNATDDIKFVLGLKAGLNIFSIDYNRLNIYNPEEYVYSNGNLSETKPLIGAGFYVYSDNWFMSMSTPNLLEHRLEGENAREFYNKIPHMYISAGYDYRMNSVLLVKSQLTTQIVKGAPLAYLFSSRVIYNDKIGFGAHFQPNSLVGLMLSYQIKDGFVINYGNDTAISQLSKYSNGNHSFGLSYQFGKPKKCNCDDDVELKDRVYMIR